MRHARFLTYAAFAIVLAALPRWLDPWGKALGFGLALFLLVVLALRRDPLEDTFVAGRILGGLVVYGAVVVSAVAGGAHVYRAYLGADEALRSVPLWARAAAFALSGCGVAAALHETGRGVAGAIRSRDIVRAVRSLLPAAAAAVLVTVAGFSGKMVLAASSVAALSAFFALWSLSVFGGRLRERVRRARERVRAAADALRGRLAPPAATVQAAWPQGDGEGRPPLRRIRLW
jgi:hypothetical protein